MRIGIITHNYPKTSKERQDAGIFLYDFAQELAKKHKVFVLSPNFEGEKEEYKAVPVTWYNWRGGKAKLGSINVLNPQSVLEFISLLKDGNKAAHNFVKDNKIEFILAAWAFPAGALAASVSRDLHVPYATWSLGSDINQYAKIPGVKQFITHILKNATVRFANSHLLCGKIESLSNKPAVFLPAITNFEKIRTIKKNKSSNFRFLFVGRLEKVKGPDILIDAIHKLQSQGLKFEVNILGDGGMRQGLEEKAQNLKNVKFLGNANKQMVAEYMTNSDCLIIPSRSESLPLVLIEAAKMGLPIIASNVGDCKKLVDKYKIGFIVETEDSAALAQKMKDAIKEGTNFKKKRLKRLSSLANQFKQANAVSIMLNTIK